jgi:predicted ATPase
VRAASGILESDSADLARQKLRRALEQLLPRDEVADSNRHLGLLLGLGVGDDTYLPNLLFFAGRRFAEATALARPTLLVFEDIHWAQTSELDLLEYLATFTRDAPVLFVAPARAELLDLRPGWGSGLAQTTIALDPLGEGDAAELAGLLLAATGEAVDPSRLVEVAEGNPLFLEELAASVTERGEDSALPVTVREAIASRIDAIPENARAVLLSAAVIGKTFWRDVVRKVGGIEDPDEE